MPLQYFINFANEFIISVDFLSSIVQTMMSYSGRGCYSHRVILLINSIANLDMLCRFITVNITSSTKAAFLVPIVDDRLLLLEIMLSFPLIIFDADIDNDASFLSLDLGMR